MKKLLAMLLAVVMVLGLVACTVNENPGNTTTKPSTPADPSASSSSSTPDDDLYYNPTGLPICDETITIKVSGTVGNTTNWQDTYMVKWIEENMGIKMECEPVSRDIRETKYGLWLTDTTQMPDLIINAIGASKAQVDTDGAAGFWLNCAEYLELMPNLKAFCEKNPAYEGYITTADGGIYSFTRTTPTFHQQIGNQIFYHTATLAAAGVDGAAIKTVDDLYDALVKLKAYYPDKTPLLLTPDVDPAANIDRILRAAFGVYSKENSFMVVEDEDGNVSLADTSKENREYLKFINKLHKEGLIDLTDITRDKNDVISDVKEGKYCFYTGEFAPVTAEEQAKKDANDYSWEQNFGIIAALTSENVTETAYLYDNGIQDAARVIIAGNTKYPEAIVRLVDYFFSEEGMLLAFAGVEGETFEWQTDTESGLTSINHENFYDKEKYTNSADWVKNEVVINQAIALNWGGLGGLASLTDDQWDDFADNSMYKFISRKVLAVKACDNLIQNPMPYIMNAEQSDEAGSLPTDIKAYLEVAKIEFMMGTNGRDINSDASWRLFVNQVEDMGWDVLQPIYQEIAG